MLAFTLKAARRAAFLLVLASGLHAGPGLALTHDSTGGESLDLPPATSSANSCVILLHGMALGAWSLRALERGLREAGYTAHNQSYPSRTQPVHKLANQAVHTGLAACRAQDARRIHFVTHSLGGILVRLYLQDHTIPELGRIVMLAPPNHGSEIADLLKTNPLYQGYFGDAGQQLGTEAGDLIASLKPIPGEIGVIAANRSLEPWFSKVLPGPDDGKVSVASARLSEMRDFVQVSSTHTLILWNGEALRQALHFLEHGVFIHKPGSEGDSIDTQ